MAKTYYEKLRDPKWQRKRLEIMQRAGFSCEWCGDGAKTLHIHHGYYAKGHEPWDYGEDTLYCLCEVCHEKAEVNKHDIHIEIARVHPRDLRELLQNLFEWKSKHPRPTPTDGVGSQPQMVPSEVSTISDVPVIVVGVSNGEITETGLGYQEYGSITTAQIQFPDLDPNQNTPRFTWAMKEMRNGKVARLRFETWNAYDLYST